MADSSVAITAGSGTPIRVLTGLGAGSADQQVITLADSAGNLLGTSGAPLPIEITGSGGLPTVVGSLTAAGTNVPGTASTASTTGQVVAAVPSAGNVTFHLVTSAFVGTIVFEASVDAGLNYAPMMAIREDGTGSENSIAISTATALIRLYTAALPGIAYFRVRCSAFTSGSLAVILAPGPTLIEPTPSLAASTNAIGQVLPSTLVVSASAAAAIGTCTLPAAGAGLFHYITNIRIERNATAATTGANSGFVTGGTNHSLVFQLPSDTQAIGFQQTVVDYRPTAPLRVTAANTATTVTTPLVTATTYRITVTYYTAP